MYDWNVFLKAFFFLLTPECCHSAEAYTYCVCITERAAGVTQRDKHFVAASRSLHWPSSVTFPGRSSSSLSVYKHTSLENNLSKTFHLIQFNEPRSSPASSNTHFQARMKKKTLGRGGKGGFFWLFQTPSKVVSISEGVCSRFQFVLTTLCCPLRTPQHGIETLLMLPYITEAEHLMIAYHRARFTPPSCSSSFAPPTRRSARRFRISHLSISLGGKTRKSASPPSESRSAFIPDQIGTALAYVITSTSATFADKDHSWVKLLCWTGLDSSWGSDYSIRQVFSS